MENKGLISIVIPAYNAEPFLKECIDSIIVQTYPFFEVLIIENCSTDLTLKIANSYIQVDNRIKVFSNVEKGAAKARNIGIDNSKGKYLTFVDADDKITPDYLESLIKGIQLNNADISICSMIGSLVVPELYCDLKDKKDRKKAFNFFNGSTVCKLYTRKIINEIRYDDIKVGEDPLFNLNILLQNPSIQYINYSGYYYLHNDSSITSNFNSTTIDIILIRNILGFNYIKIKDDENGEVFKFWLLDSIQQLLSYYKNLNRNERIYSKSKLVFNKNQYKRIITLDYLLFSIFNRINIFFISDNLLKLLMHYISFKIRFKYPLYEVIRFYKNKLRNNELRIN
mgnify:CR=1 FL=1